MIPNDLSLRLPRRSVAKTGLRVLRRGRRAWVKNTCMAS